MDDKNLKQNPDHECDCGHNHDHEHACECDHEHDQNIVIVTLDDSTDVECSVLGIFEVDEKSYIALLPIGGEEVLIYVYQEDGTDIKFDLIESDEEFESVSAAFYELFADSEDEE